MIVSFIDTIYTCPNKQTKNAGFFKRQFEVEVCTSPAWPASQASKRKMIFPTVWPRQANERQFFQQAGSGNER